MDSLTGDPELDRLVPAAVRLTCGLREWDREEVAAALNDAAAASPRPDVLTHLCVVLAAMVPWDQPPAELLAWVRRRAEYERLRALGVDAAIAADLTASEGG